MVWFNDTPIGLSQSTSAFTCSKNASDRAYGNCDLVSNFQRNFCSNFVCICCYVRLPSLHDLYDHVEEAHIGPSGMRAWPPKVFSELSEISGPPRATSPSKDQDSDCTPDESVLAIAYSTQDFDSDSAIVFLSALHCVIRFLAMNNHIIPLHQLWRLVSQQLIIVQRLYKIASQRLSLRNTVVKVRLARLDPD
ncbi:MAG: hypothetical protein NXY57DRAFT_740258 [Lentinula lateritia]|nr:MAG: hypothetical protein NXY57DRAFT_740258 [Lentinula lateritia]